MLEPVETSLKKETLFLVYPKDLTLMAPEDVSFLSIFR